MIHLAQSQNVKIVEAYCSLKLFQTDREERK